jgi:Na+/glutamate symporter
MDQGKHCKIHSANGSKNRYNVTDLPVATEDNRNDSSTLQLLILLMLFYMVCLLIGLLRSVYIGPDTAKWPLFAAMALSGVIVAISCNFERKGNGCEKW